MFADLLRQRLGGVATLTSQQIEQLQRHYELLLRWNKVLNLTSVRADEIVERHYGESLFLGAHLPAGRLRVADIGSGAGFPGFPVAVLRPDCQVTLIESHQRKAVFLKEASRDLTNIRVVSKRSEDVTERFDWAISRAVRLNDVQMVAKRLGSFVMFLGGEADLSSSGFSESVPLPWGKRRYLLVSRETEPAPGGCI